MKIKKALVTGGSTGIGLAICEHLLAQGVEVFSISRNPSKLLENTKVTQISLDLSETDLISSFAENFISEHGSPDLLVNNAGYGAFYELANFPEQEIVRQTAVLFTSNEPPTCASCPYSSEIKTFSDKVDFTRL